MTKTTKYGNSNINNSKNTSTQWFDDNYYADDVNVWWQKSSEWMNTRFKQWNFFIYLLLAWFLLPMFFLQFLLLLLSLLLVLLPFIRAKSGCLCVLTTTTIIFCHSFVLLRSRVRVSVRYLGICSNEYLFDYWYPHTHTHLCMYTHTYQF